MRQRTAQLDCSSFRHLHHCACSESSCYVVHSRNAPPVPTNIQQSLTHRVNHTSQSTTCDLAESLLLLLLLLRCTAHTSQLTPSALVRYLQFRQEMPLFISSLSFFLSVFLLSSCVYASLFALRRLVDSILDGREEASQDLENTRDMFANRQYKNELTDWLPAVTTLGAQLKGNLNLQIGFWVKVQWQKKREKERCATSHLF